MSSLRRYLFDPFYWRRGILRLGETLTGRLHVETYLDQLLLDKTHAVERPDGDPTPGSGLRLLYVAPKLDYGNPPPARHQRRWKEE